MADGRHFENRYIATSQWKIIRFWWNFVHSSRFWTGWTSRDQKWIKLHWTDSEFDRTYCLLLYRIAKFLRPALVGRTKRVELIGNNLHRLIVCGLEQFVLKFWTKIQITGVLGVLGDPAFKWKEAWKWRLRQISRYLQNNTRYGRSYNGTQIGSHTRSIEWCYFQ